MKNDAEMERIEMERIERCVNVYRHYERFNKRVGEYIAKNSGQGHYVIEVSRRKDNNDTYETSVELAYINSNGGLGWYMPWFTGQEHLIALSYSKISELETDNFRRFD